MRLQIQNDSACQCFKQLMSYHLQETLMISFVINVPLDLIATLYSFSVEQVFIITGSYSIKIAPTLITVHCLFFGLIIRCSQTAKKVSHIKGRLLDQAVILFNCIPFQNGNFS